MKYTIIVALVPAGSELKVELPLGSLFSESRMEEGEHQLLSPCELTDRHARPILHALVDRVNAAPPVRTVN